MGSTCSGGSTESRGRDMSVRQALINLKAELMVRHEQEVRRYKPKMIQIERLLQERRRYPLHIVEGQMERVKKLEKDEDEYQSEIGEQW